MIKRRNPQGGRLHTWRMASIGHHFQTIRAASVGLYSSMLLPLFFLCSLVLACPALADGSARVLILNSYHKGYAWSDQIVNGLENSILHSRPAADIRVEYMDTKRNVGDTYFEQTSAFYRAKYGNHSFDLIVACDDTAIKFVLNEAETLFPETPIVFCGANTLDLHRVLQNPLITGVLERTQIAKTLQIAKKLRPKTDKVLVINDQTVTGRNVRRDLARQLPILEKEFTIEELPALPLAQLEQRVAIAGPHTAVLLLAYFRDVNGTYYSPEVTAQRLNRATSVPIYTVWDFYFDYGVAGGAMMTGYLQGEAAAKMVLEILDGKPVEEVPIQADVASWLAYDLRQLTRFKLPLAALPQDAVVQHIDDHEEKHTLMINSYAAGTPWTGSIVEGVEETFAERGINTTLHIEYMDTKRFFNKAYLNLLKKTYAHKYSQMPLNLVMVSDDNAYSFVLRHRESLFPGVPIVFCGVNYLARTEGLAEQRITGVVESYDVLGTVQLALETFPQTRNIFVVNDNSRTGRANRLRLEAIRSNLPDDVTLSYCGSQSMRDLQRQLQRLGEETVVLLMSFTRDKNNERFSYEESAELISASSARPVFSFWDFYLGHGIVGGVITAGIDQGRTAASLAAAVLSGTSLTVLPVIRKNPVTPTLDNAVLQRFSDAPSRIKKGVLLLNAPPSFMESYRRPFLIVFSLIVALLPLLGIIVFLQRRKQQRLSHQVETDPLTGTKNRDYLQRHLKDFMAECTAKKMPLTLCFIDLDNLKAVNDRLGHDQGDRYLLLVVESIRSHVRSNDVICRVGGDEFIVLLPNCGSLKARELCAQVNQDLLSIEDYRTLGVGVSCGMSTYTAKRPMNGQALMKEADNDMYRQKKRKKTQRKRLIGEMS